MESLSKVQGLFLQKQNFQIVYSETARKFNSLSFGKHIFAFLRSLWEDISVNHQGDGHVL